MRSSVSFGLEALHAVATSVLTPAFLRPRYGWRRVEGWRAGRAGLVLLKRDPAFGPRLQHRGQHAPGLLGFVAPDRQGAVPVQDVHQHAAVGWQLGRGELRFQGQRRKVGWPSCWRSCWRFAY
jgi:hypothetical protein